MRAKAFRIMFPLDHRSPFPLGGFAPERDIKKECSDGETERARRFAEVEAYARDLLLRFARLLPTTNNNPHPPLSLFNRPAHQSFAQRRRGRRPSLSVTLPLLRTTLTSYFYWSINLLPCCRHATGTMRLLLARWLPLIVRTVYCYDSWVRLLVRQCMVVRM